MSVRQSIDYDQDTKQVKFKHENYPYRHHLYAKQELVEQRIVNRQKRMKIRDMEEEIRGLQRNVEDMRTAGARRSAVEARKSAVEVRRSAVKVRRSAVGPGMSRERDCDEDFWLRRM